MPQVAIQVRSGREPESLRTSLDAAPAAVRVIVTEVPTTHWANGGVTLAEAAPASGGASDA